MIMTLSIATALTSTHMALRSYVAEEEARGDGGMQFLPVHTVTFDTRGGSEIPSFEVFFFSTISEPDPPVLEGSEFAGWYRDLSLSKEWSFRLDRVTSDVTLYAKWAEPSPSG
jgi:uncharacterized repeat protein (TIGR02543 family)